MTGELLVNGLPRGRLPSGYETHGIYRDLFGHAAVDCMPTTEPGMHFGASKLHEGFEVRFAMEADTIAVRASKAGETWESVPCDTFEGFLPSIFLKDTVFWYNLNTPQVVLCPKSTPWDLEHAPWSMHKTGLYWNMIQAGGDTRLIFPSSATAEEYARVLDPLETKLGLHIMAKRNPQSLHVHIPRFLLDFHVEEESEMIMSRQFKGMRVDRIQGIGTLVGLNSKLVLVQAESSHSRDRKVLIPEGSLAISASSGSTNVTINRCAHSVQPYYVDERLGQLKGNGSLTSMLFLAELHAVTSGSLPDHLTGRTGTEKALEILDSAAVSSLDISSQQEADYLDRIRQLSPVRSFYPRNLQVMQTVAWRPELPTQAQSDMFLFVAQKLYAEAEKRQFLSQSNLPILRQWNGDCELNERALLRSYTARGTRKHPIPCIPDVVYDENLRYSKEQRVKLDLRHKVAVRFGAALRHGETLVDDDKPVVDAKALYSTLSDSAVSGSAKAKLHSDFYYDANLLKKPASILPSRWCGWHRSLTQACRRGKKTQLIAWISTLAFAEKSQFACLQALLAFASVSAATELAIPSEQTYCLDKGDIYQENMVSMLLRSLAHGFECSAEAQLRREKHETYEAAHRRRRETYSANLDRDVRRVERELRAQWPCSEPQVREVSVSYLSFTEVSPQILDTFRVWYNNWMFRQYLDQVCSILGLTPTTRLHVDSLATVKPHERSRKEEPLRSLGLIDVLTVVRAPSLGQGQQQTPIDTVLAKYIEERLIEKASEAPKDALRSSISSEQPSSVELLSKSLSAKATCFQEHSYVEKLDESITSLSTISCHEAFDTTPAVLQEAAVETFVSAWIEDVAKSHWDTLRNFTQILKLQGAPEKQSYRSLSPTWRLISKTHHWPQVTCHQLLALIGFQTRGQIPLEWKKAIIELGKTVINFQTASRLKKVRSNPQELLRELKNTRQRSWDPMEYPDSLLLEIEGSLRIRQVQSDIAEDMITPLQGLNTVMQLNMGEGKSSVIVPMVASHLADGEKLARVIVAKPQPPQMKDVLVSKLGGLMDRKVYQMPLSRSIRLTAIQADFLQASCRLTTASA